MASSRSSPPASRGGSPDQDQFQSPRTKIRALLAAVDSSDDEGGVATTNLTGNTSPTPNTEEPSLPKPTSRQESDGDDSDVDMRPRGRLASRMQGPKDATKEAQSATTTAGTETTRERVKRMLQQEEEAEAETETQTTRNEASADIEDADDELPVAPRRLKRRAPRESTPSASQSPAQLQSPGLFVSSPIRPSPAKSTAGHNSESENDMPAIKSDRFKALVERKRQERLAREAAEKSRNAERREQQEKLASELQELDSDDDNVSNITDDEGGRKLTQGARPTRKASKKAIEEMSRETQRMARSMQLAHEAKTRKKISKASLFERFNYRPAGGAEPQLEIKMSSSSRPVSPHTDVEMKEVDTPPSSPPPVAKQDLADATGNAEQDDDLPNLEAIMSSSPPKLDKGKGKAIDVEGIQAVAEEPKRRLKFKLPDVTTNLVTLDSDDELEVTKAPNAKLDAVFKSIPSKRAQESHSLQALRALAHVKSPSKDNGRRKAEHSGMSAGELQASLYQKARQQAKRERDRRLDMLKAQGAVVQTVEGRERQMQEVEDIVAKARDEAQKIMQQERADAKNNNDGEADPLAWDDSDDEEYKDSANEADTEASAVELSGSEEEGDEEEEDGNDGEMEGQLIDGEAEDGKSDVSVTDQEAAETAGQDADEEDDAVPVVRQRRSRNKTTVLSDDEAEVNVEATPKPKTTTFVSPAAPNTISPAAPTSVLRSAKKTFIPGLPVQGAAGLGLTQIFAGTMDDSQMSAADGPTQSMMPDFNNFPDSNFSATMEEPADDMVVDSQIDDTQKPTQKPTQGIQLNYSQSQMRGLDSLLREDATQMSQMIELSQDGGLQEHPPLRERFVEPPFSTVETIQADQLDEDPNVSPIVRRGRLRRKMQTQVAEEEDVPQSPERTAAADSAFNVLKDAAKQEKKARLTDDFNRKKSKAKEMVHEQAEESEDEYAGLGGADGEDSDNDSNASVQDIIDDEAGNDMDGRKLAAFYADRERANDEKEVEKLFKDITTGMLRRKRGADYDLSDSDDGGEARRRMKRRQFSKMQKALFADERVKKMAEDPGNQAFLRTIEDRGSDEEMDFLDYVDPTSEKESQSQSREATEQPQTQTGHTVPDSQPRKPLGTAEEIRAPANLRRTKDGKKPSNIGDVRETLSNLLDDPQGSVIPATEIGSDSDEEEQPPSIRSDKENQAPNLRHNSSAIVDRISLKRSGSSTASTSSSTRLAFAAPTATSSFKVPALLRRATTNSSMITGSGSSDKGATTTAAASTATSTGGGFGNDTKIKKSAGKKSGVHGFARENERRTKIQESERRRQQKRARGAEKRVGLVGGLLAKGSFE